MPLPIFLVWGVVVGLIVHHFTGSLFLAIIGGVVSFPASIWILDLVFNNPLSLKLQNYPGNYSCPTCSNRYEKFVSMPSDNGTLTLQCLKCGAKHRFNKRYVHIEKIDSPTDAKAEQVADGNPH